MSPQLEYWQNIFMCLKHRIANMYNSIQLII